MSHVTSLDIRLPIGGLFTALGLIVGGYGLATGADAARYAPSLGVNVNLWWGMVMLVFGVLHAGGAPRGHGAGPRRIAPRTRPRGAPPRRGSGSWGSSAAAGNERDLRRSRIMTRSRTSSHGEVRQLPLAAGAVAGVAAYGEAELVLPLPAAMVVKLSALFPSRGGVIRPSARWHPARRRCGRAGP